MRILKRVLRELHRYVFLAIVVTIFWAWIFTLLLNAPPRKKIVLFSDTPQTFELDLNDALSDPLPEGIRMIDAHPFAYAAFDGSEIDNADLLILSEADMDLFLGTLQRLAVPQEGAYLDENGEPVGYLMFDPDTGYAVASRYFVYRAPGADAMRYYVCVNRSSLHIRSYTGSGDDAALITLQKLLQLP